MFHTHTFIILIVYNYSGKEKNQTFITIYELFLFSSLFFRSRIGERFGDFEVFS